MLIYFKLISAANGELSSIVSHWVISWSESRLGVLCVLTCTRHVVAHCHGVETRLHCENKKSYVPIKYSFG